MADASYFGVTAKSQGDNWYAWAESDCGDGNGIWDSIYGYLKDLDVTGITGHTTDDGFYTKANSANYAIKAEQAGAGFAFQASGASDLASIKTTDLYATGTDSIEIRPHAVAATFGCDIDVVSDQVTFDTASVDGFYFKDKTRLQNMSFYTSGSYHYILSETDKSVLITGGATTTTNEIILIPTYNNASDYEEGISVERVDATNVLFKAFQDFIDNGNTNTLANMQMQVATTYFDTAGGLIIDSLDIDGTTVRITNANHLTLRGGTGGKMIILNPDGDNVTDYLMVNRQSAAEQEIAGSGTKIRISPDDGNLTEYLQINREATNGITIRNFGSGTEYLSIIPDGNVSDECRIYPGTGNQGVKIVASGTVGTNLYLNADTSYIDTNGNLTLNGKGIMTTAGLRTKIVALDNGGAAPTDATLDAQFGTPATVGSGFIGVFSDTNAAGVDYLVESNGTEWWYVAMTMAV